MLNMSVNRQVPHTFHRTWLKCVIEWLTGTVHCITLFGSPSLNTIPLIWKQYILVLSLNSWYCACRPVWKPLSVGLNIHLYDMTYSIMCHMMNKRVSQEGSRMCMCVCVCVHILHLMCLHPFNHNSLPQQVHNLKENTVWMVWYYKRHLIYSLDVCAQLVSYSIL